LIGSPLAPGRRIWLDARMSSMPWTALAATLLVAACAPPQPLEVFSHVVRDEQRDEGSDPMGRNEKLRRLHGAVSMEERRNLLGQYFTIRWNDDAVGAPVTITFEYQQGATGSRVKTIRREFPGGDASGTTEITVIGDDYFKGGRVLAWRATLRRGDRVVATRKSYLWQ
jgi:hypothetical protein